jgi:ParB/RepB/Spo0J family partition protein
MTIRTLTEGPKSLDIGLSGIAVLPDRMRSLRQEVVNRLAESMKVNGLLQPIVLRPASIGYYLVAGHHRLEAARKLRWQGIRAIIFDGMDADRAALAEIDENLVRANLSPAEEAAHHAERKRLYQKLHPSKKRGANQHTNKSFAQNEESADTYTESAAKKIGKSRATVDRAVKRGREIPNVAELTGTSLDQGDELDALAKLPADERATLIERAKAGEKVSARQPRLQLTPLEKILRLLPELTPHELWQLRARLGEYKEVAE